MWVAGSTSPRNGGEALRRAGARARSPVAPASPRGRRSALPGTPRPPRLWRRSRRGRRGPTEAPARRGPTPRAQAAAPRSARRFCLRRMRSCVHLPTRLSSELVSSLELVFQLDQTAGNTACNRPSGQFQRLADRAIALVPREEAGEDLGGGFWQTD